MLFPFKLRFFRFFSSTISSGRVVSLLFTRTNFLRLTNFPILAGISFRLFPLKIKISKSQMSIYQFSRLPEELLQEILLQSNYDNIQKLCSISNDFMNICMLDKFWRFKFIHDYGFNPPTKGLTQTLEQIYLNQNNVFFFWF